MTADRVKKHTHWVSVGIAQTCVAGEWWIPSESRAGQMFAAALAEAQIVPTSVVSVRDRHKHTVCLTAAYDTDALTDPEECRIKAHVERHVRQHVVDVRTGLSRTMALANRNLNA